MAMVSLPLVSAERWMPGVHALQALFCRLLAILGWWIQRQVANVFFVRKVQKVRLSKKFVLQILN